MNNTYFRTSESVLEGHPDKIADQISDALVDAFLAQDQNAKVACETLVNPGMVLIGGEVNSEVTVDFNDTARRAIKEIGYDKLEYGFDYENALILTEIEKQSPELRDSMTHGAAGDQGIVMGYACNDTPEFMPLPIALAHQLASKASELRKNNQLSYLRPDGKTQVTVEYEDEIPKRVSTVVLSLQHNEDVELKKLQEDVMEHIVAPIIKNYVDQKTLYLINPAGQFILGGPIADTGMTGRKLMVDSYGGCALIGGGCFSGKDPSKLDRSGAYMARYIAKNIVAAQLASRCEVQIAYAIGVKGPIAFSIRTFGTGKVPDKRLEELAQQIFPLTTDAIIKTLDLLRPIYRKTACYGHFGRSDADFSWEKTDRINDLTKAVSS